MTSILSLSDAKTWLRYSSPTSASSDDASIQIVIDAVNAMLEYRVGVIVPRLFTEYYSPDGSAKIWLRNPPVIEIAEIVENWGPVSFDLSQQQPTTGPIIYGSGSAPSLKPATDLWAYSIDVPEIGEISRRGPMNTLMPFFAGDRGVQVTYRAGRDPISPALLLAARSLLAHIWSNEEQRSMTLSGSNIAYDAVTGVASMRPDTAPALWAGIPNRIIQMIESEAAKLPAIA